MHACVYENMHTAIDTNAHAQQVTIMFTCIHMLPSNYNVRRTCRTSTATLMLPI